LSDLFISHASEDKDAIARPLAAALRERGWSIWFDEFELSLGDRLREKIDQGLAEARFGLVILTPSFFSKRWARRELDGLTAREMADPERKVILPVWHEVDRDYVARFSPPLADLIAVRSSDPLETIVDGIEYVLRRELGVAQPDGLWRQRRCGWRDPAAHSICASARCARWTGSAGRSPRFSSRSAATRPFYGSDGPHDRESDPLRLREGDGVAER